ncbi:hypothetical protein GCM10011519_20230 [Marmoricola endophyticus]|uniref:NAD(P)-dependent oxidoreductase n=1 Tax=Marmoricola endophyticus TaxID=2040280 RepID=A0A917BJH9_9ACTN|nr:NAD(P)-dependent oxidoreductase [Marmoricola endophyticus]GGF46246.1 hypothetical protein GCM10011519_20230 [Marmoricola endophyticus]
MTHPGPTVVALLGLGEAGSAFAADLVAAGALVRAYDPAVAPPQGTTGCDDERDAATGSDLVLSVNSASAAEEALAAGLPGLAPGAVWADLNTGSPGLKRRLAATASSAGAHFSDVAIMAPVPGKGLAVPLLASGDAADRVQRLLAPLGARVDLQRGGAGEAAQRKLLRSVFFKGLAAAVVEALEAAEAAGCRDWLVENIADELEESGPATVQRLVDGSRVHATRRREEMAAAVDMLHELGVDPLVAAASRDLLTRLRDHSA